MLFLLFFYNKINEEFYLGFSSSYDKLTNSTNEKNLENWIVVPIETDSVLIIDGQIAKIRNYGIKIKATLIDVVIPDYEELANSSQHVKEFLT